MILLRTMLTGVLVLGATAAASAADHILFCGIALGFADEGAAVNRWRAPRAPVDAFATFRGFPD